MYHNILIQKNHTHQLQIEKAVESLLVSIETDSIYFSEHLEESINVGIVTVIISKNNPHFWDDIYEYSSKIFEAFPEFSFRVFDGEWLEEGLTEGNPFFVMHCSENELVYSAGDSGSTVLLKKLKAKKIIESTLVTFERDFKRSSVIGQNLHFYLRNENSTMAAYTMQQQLRFLFISASWFLTGEEIAEHSLEAQQNHLCKFSSLLSKIFDPEKEDEWKVLEQLENARAAIQCNVEIEPISKETLEIASEKVKWVENEVERLFQKSIVRCKEKLGMSNDEIVIKESVTATILKPDFPDSVTAVLTEVSLIIRDYIRTDAIYCFGYRYLVNSNSTGIFIETKEQTKQIHFHLIVLTEKREKNVFRKLNKLIRTKTRGRAAATLLLHETASLRELKADQYCFFKQILEPKSLVYQRQDIQSYINLEIDQTRNLSESKLDLGNRERISLSFLQAYTANEDKGETVLGAVFLNQAVQHICLGLINTILGYCPNHYSVYHLISICDNFTPLTLDLFPRNTFQESRLFSILCYGPSAVRDNDIDAFRYSEMQVLSKRCWEFHERASKLARKELKRLKKTEDNNLIVNE